MNTTKSASRGMECYYNVSVCDIGLDLYRLRCGSFFFFFV
jgi:hypothetical protein